VNVPLAILAGGLATRLRPVTREIPKSLIEIAGKPFIIHQIELLRRNGIDHIVLCLGYLGDMVQAALGDGRVLDVHIDYVFDGPTLLGTGGALKKSLPLLGEAFFVLYGDSYLDVDYETVQNAFEESGKLGLMTVYHNAGRWDRSNVLFLNGQIIRYNKRQPAPEMQHIDYGLGVLRKEAFAEFPDGENFDLAKVFQALSARNQLAGYEVTQRFYEIGSPEGLEETRRFLSRRLNK
jgi:NDP-sugar pyrophosphorylase family protein